jgi:hypothetical protein
MAVFRTAKIGGGKAPTGRLKLNPRHRPRGLVFAAPLFSQGVQGARDLVSGVAGVHEGTGTLPVPHQATPWGRVPAGVLESENYKITWRNQYDGRDMSLSNWTAAAWVWENSDRTTSTYQRQFLAGGMDAGSRGVGIGVNGTSYFGNVRTSNQGLISAASSRVAGQWTHVAMTTTGVASREIWINGQLHTSAVNAANVAAINFDSIALQAHPNYAAAQGCQVADAILCETLLTAEEIWALYEPSSRWNHYQRVAPVFYSFPEAPAAALTTTVFRAPRPAWTRPPPNVIGTSEPLRTAYLFAKGDAGVRGSGNTDPFIARSTAATTQTKYGRAWAVGNNNQGMGAANSPSPVATYSATMLCRVDGHDGSWAPFWYYTDSLSVQAAMFFGRTSGSNAMQVYHNNSGSTSSPAMYDAVFTGEWLWLTIVSNGTNWKGYVNGQLIVTTAYTQALVPYSDGICNLGQWKSSTTSNEMHGEIAAFWVVEREMQPAEIRHRHSPQGQWDWLRTAPQRFIETAAAAAAATGWEYGAGFDRDPVRFRGNPRDVVINGRANSHWATLRRYVP